MAKKRKAAYDPRASMCASHNAKFEWLTEEDVERRASKGHRQERCSKCLLWLWPEERGRGFVSTGELDTD